MPSSPIAIDSVGAADLECPIPRREPLMVVCCAVVAGVLAFELRWGGVVVWMLGTVAGLAAWQGLRPSRMAAVALWGAVACFAAFRTHEYSSTFPPNHVKFLLGEQSVPAVLEGRLRGAVTYRRSPPTAPWHPRPGRTTARFLLETSRVRRGRRWDPVQGAVRVVVDIPAGRPRLPARIAGSSIRVWGRLSGLRHARNPGGYSSRVYWRAYRVTARLDVESPESLVVLESGRRTGMAARYWLERLREHARRAVEDWVPLEQQGLAAAIVLGDRGGIDERELRSFRDTGTAHLLAVSGMHVAIALCGWWWLLRMVPGCERHAWWSTLWVAAGYAWFTGGQPPVWRATLWIGGWLIAVRLGRAVAHRQLLAAVALAMWVVRPLSWTQSGVQLSLAAVGALMWWSQVSRPPTLSPLDRLVRDSAPRWRRLASWIAVRARYNVGVSLAVTSALLPLVWQTFQAIPLAGVLLTPVLAIAMSVALWAGLATVAFAALPGAVGAGWAGAVCGVALEFGQWLNSAASPLLPAVRWAPPPRWYCMSYYVLFLGMWCAQGRNFRMRRGLACTAGYLLAARLWFGGPAAAELECVVFSVGHGSCVWVHTPDGRNWLCDAGTMGDAHLTGREIARSLRTLGVTRLDGVYLSHADADHFNLVPYLASELPVSEVLLTPIMLRRVSRRFPQFFEELAERGIEWGLVRRGDRFAFSKLSIEVWHPGPVPSHWSDNESSLVLGLEYAGRQLVFPGDLEQRGEREVWSVLQRQVRSPLLVLVAPHHGSRHSHPEFWSSRFEPRHVIVSGSARTARATIERWRHAPSSQVWHTSAGAVRIRCLRGHWTVQQWNGDGWSRNSVGCHDAAEGLTQ